MMTKMCSMRRNVISKKHRFGLTLSFIGDGIAD
jgi:hypothetical protein